MEARESKYGAGAANDFRKAFGQFSSSKTQLVDSLKPVEIQIHSQEDVAGGVHTIDFDKGEIIIKQSGMYLIIAGPQVGKSKGTRNRWIDFWLRVNNVDVPTTLPSGLTCRQLIPLSSIL